MFSCSSRSVVSTYRPTWQVGAFRRAQSALHNALVGILTSGIDIEERKRCDRITYFFSLEGVRPLVGRDPGGKMSWNDTAWP